MSDVTVKELGEGWKVKQWTKPDGSLCSEFIPPDNWNGSSPSWAAEWESAFIGT